MSNAKHTRALAAEITKYYQYAQEMNSDEYFIERMLQLIDREKIKVINRYRENHGEPLLIPEPQRYKTVGSTLSWIIDVPKSWISLVGKDKES